ncbi:MAG: hypothetical protein BGO41_08205 [Clostridiales bacterium 38-18]|nr:MAG: hypothetical protein BGO41_08205 [Clostridiales bacterium 38-18]
MIYIENSDSKTPLFHLQTLKSSYILKVLENGKVVNLHYGDRVEHSDYLSTLYQNYDIQVGSAVLYEKGSQITLETLLLEQSTYGKGDYRHASLKIEFDDGISVSDFIYHSHVIHERMVHPDGMPHARAEAVGYTLEIVLKETQREVFQHLYYSPFEASNCIVRWTKINNLTTSSFLIHAIKSLQLDLPNSDYECLSLDGTWIHERQLNQGKLRPGILTIDSKKGVSSSAHNPYIGLKGLQTTENQGEAIGFALVYSGNHMASVEVSPYQMTRVTIGLSEVDFRWLLKSGESFDTPECVMSFSGNGLNGLSQNFHHIINHHIVSPYWQYRSRPIGFNNWEATYFDFNQKKLLSMAKIGKQLGMELFVMDDGWFKNRTDDTKALGDWTADDKKLPNGLSGIGKAIRKLGLQFGIWVEPEMISEDSDLYRKHSEWAIRLPDRAPSLGRNQLVLDLSNPEVVDYLFKSISNVIMSSGATFVKWDMNRNFSDLHSFYLSKYNQSELTHRYVLGLYRLLDQLTQAYPEVLFESCASGGNRYDMGMLYYMPQIWTSDNTDAIERIEIQQGTGMVYPLSTMSAHVSGQPSHQVLRKTPIETRFNVACFGILGYEMNLLHLTPFDKKVIIKQIEFYKKHRSLFQFGTLYRHDNTSNVDRTVWTVMDETRSKFITGYFLKLHRPCPPLETIKIIDLDQSSVYKIANRLQYQDIRAFGELINPYIPIKLKENGILQTVIANRYLYPLEVQQINVTGEIATKIGLKLYTQFTGTGISDRTRLMTDFGSRLYIGERE